MPGLSTIYTGKNAGAPVYTGKESLNALEGGMDDLLRAKQTELGYAKKEEQDFLAGLKVDPVSTASRNVMNEQAKMIEGAQDRWINEMAKSKGKMTLAQKARMQADMMDISAWQEGKLADYNEYLEAEKRFSSRPDLYDRTEYYNARDKYIQDGVRPEGGYLQPSALPQEDFVSGLRALALEGETDYKKSGRFRVQSPDGDRRAYISTWTEEDARKAHEGYVLGGGDAPRKIRTILESWKATPQWKQEEIIAKVDENNNAKIDTESEQQNAYLEADFQKNKGVFLNTRYVPYTKPYSVTRDEKAEVEAKIENVINTGVSPTTKEPGWRVGENAIRMRYGAIPANRGFWVETDKIDNLPKGAVVQGDVVYVRPMEVRKDGTISMGVMAGSLEALPDEAQDEAMMDIEDNASAAKDYVVGPDGIVYKRKKGTGFDKLATTSVEKGGDVIFTEIPDLDKAWNYLKDNSGWGSSVSPASVGGKGKIDFGIN